MDNKEHELSTLINFLQYDIAKLKEELQSKYHEGYMDGKAFKDRHITIRDHFAGLAMQGIISTSSKNAHIIPKLAYDMADEMLNERDKNDS